MSTKWVDYKQLKKEITIEMVLERYGLNSFAKSGNELRGRCPIHRGTNEKQFTVNVVKNVFQCFSPDCKARGNILEFVAGMEQCSVRDGALKLADWFGIEASPQARLPTENQGDGDSNGHAARQEGTVQTTENGTPVSGVVPEAVAKRGVVSRRATKEGVRAMAFEVLAELADLNQKDRQRVLEHALKLNQE